MYHDIPIFASIVHPANPLAAVQVLEKLIRTKPFQFGKKPLPNGNLGPYSDEFVRSQPMRHAVAQLQRLKQLPVDTVLLGPTGAGKDTAARWLHAHSGLKGEFVHVNCAALPEQLFEAEVFGVMAGAFTGAQKDRPGKLELAHNGTLYLDEIDGISGCCIAPLFADCGDCGFKQGSHHQRIVWLGSVRVHPDLDHFHDYRAAESRRARD